MRTHLYIRLAADGIRKNGRLYFPYIFTGWIMVMIHYLLAYLGSASVMSHVRGEEFVAWILSLGAIVVRLFSAIFLFYTNSFLIRQRTREFGLYHILGMNKKNIGRIMVWESVFSTLASVFGGLVLGILFSKLGEFGLLYVLGLSAEYTMSVDPSAVWLTVRVYGEIYLFLLICSVVRVWLMKPLELLLSSRTGDRPPRARWLITLAGALILGAAYYLAVTIQEPLQALLVFFVAVTMVIVSTYILFESGSVTLCRFLQGNRKYYYRPNHFVSVSSMAYRMRRNGAGLASICIMSTMILVMLSCTVSLYMGEESSLRERYPRQIEAELHLDSTENFGGEKIREFREALAAPAGSGETSDVPRQENVMEYRKLEMYGVPIDGAYVIDMEDPRLRDGRGMDAMVSSIQIFSLDDYNRMMGTEETLEDDECLIWCGGGYGSDHVALDGGGCFRVKKQTDAFFESGFRAEINISQVLNVVVKDLDSAAESLYAIRNSSGNPCVELIWEYGYDMEGGETKKAEEEGARLTGLLKGLREAEDSGISRASVWMRYVERQYDVALNGGLMFLGILLSLVFAIASVLIIYYKQISEGYEDRSRFVIMQKVGMTGREIRRNINSQILTVFFLPLLFAGLHLAFAFPLLWKIMRLFGSIDFSLFVRMTLFCYVVFGALYAAVYKMTAGAYYGIVSRAFSAGEGAN